MANDNLIYDAINSLEAGTNSGLQPLLLQKNQTAWSLNATYRGGFISTRPPFQIQTLDFAGDTSLELLVQTGLFQGAGIYRPDFGASQVLAQISGHLIAFTPTGSSWLVTDISIPGDLNDASSSQVWMWQSEKWMIINNGLQLPIFYDGATSRRSYGASVLLGTATAANPVTVPAIGDSVELTLTGVYAGDFNIPVFFHGAFYQAVESATGSNILLTGVTVAAGTTVDEGQQIEVRPGSVGYVRYGYRDPNYFGSGLLGVATTNSNFPNDYFFRVIIKDETATDVVVGNKVLINGLVLTVDSFQDKPDGNTQLTMIVPKVDVSDSYRMLTGDLIEIAGNTQPNVLIGIVNTASTPVSEGVTSSLQIDRPFTGTNGQKVWVLTNVYTIANPPPSPPSSTLTLINLTDTAGVAYSFPTDAPITSIAELPAGRMGAYGMGRNWQSLIDGISFIAGDIVGGSAGTLAYNFRDAVLKTTENDYLNGGGTFRLPGSGNIINSMTFTANLDTSLGQGALQIGTDSGFFSCNTPTDRTTWQSITNPILTESLIGQGSLAQNSTVLSNSDTIFRSIEGIGSLILARREFTTWGNTPISREVERALKNDVINLLPYGSATNFDNRLLETCYPTTSAQGVYHRMLAILNFDLTSSLRGKSPSIWEGGWTGLNVLQCVSGNFSGTGRAFALTYNPAAQSIELYEILRTTSTQHYDNGNIPITWMFETCCVFNADIKPISKLVQLKNMELMVQDIIGTVHFKIEYRADFSPCWRSYKEFDLCATEGEGKRAGYQTRVSMGEPPPDCDPNTNRAFRIGHFFQFRLTITGSAKIMGMRFAASPIEIADFAPPICSPS